MTTSQSLIAAGNNTLDRINQEIERDPQLKSDNTRRGYRHDLAQFGTGARPGP